MNSIVQVRQISQYPDKDPVYPDDRVVIQEGGLGGPYRSATVSALVSTALLLPPGRDLNFYPGFGLTWEEFPNAYLRFGKIGDDRFFMGAPLEVPSLASLDNITVGGRMVATIDDVNQLAYHSVQSFNGRHGNIQLSEGDIRRAGAAPVRDAHFAGWITAPSVWDTRSCDDTVATTNWVHRAIHDTGVAAFNGRTGCVELSVYDVNAAYAAAPPGVYPTAPSPALGDASSRIATTLFVDESLADLNLTITNEQLALLTSTYAPLASPQLTGIPSGPTANPGTNTGQLATTAFVHAAVTASTTGVVSFNTRTGAVTLTAADIANAGGATLVSPAFSGTPTAPTATPGTSSTQLATTAFVQAAVSAVVAGVSSWNGRSGAVTMMLGDITGAGGAPLSSPVFVGVPAAPTAAPGTNTTQIATTAFVEASVAAATAGVASFNGRTGVVTLSAADVSAAGGALLASPAFTGSPAAPTAAPGTSTTQIASTAFVMAAVSGATAGVTTFNGRSGAVTLTQADVNATGILTSPALSGTPTAPTPAPGNSTTQLATTAFVEAAISAIPAAVSSFNTRTGAVTLQANDVSAVGGALVSSPTFTGTPAAPTPAPGTNSTQIATTAFVMAALTASAVTSFNGRAGAVTLSLADITGAGGAPLASPALTGTPTAPTASPGTSNTQVATTAFVAAAAGGAPALLGSASASNSAQVAITGIPAGYSVYELAFINIVPATNNSDLTLQFSTNNGSTWDTAAVYSYAGYGLDYGASQARVKSSNVSTGFTLSLLLSEFSSTPAFGGACGFVKMYGLGNAAVNKQVLWQLGLPCTAGTNGWAGYNGAGVYLNTAAAVNAVRLVMASGNIVSGTIKLYGVN